MDFLFTFARGVLGIATIVGIAYLFSSNRRLTNWGMIGTGLLLQIIIAIFILKGPAMGNFFAPLGWPKMFLSWVSSLFVTVLEFSSVGAAFLFGELGMSPTNMVSPGTPLVTGQGWGNLIAFQVLPTIIFFGSLIAVLYHLGIMQRLVQAMAYVVRRILKTSGVESLAVTANIFVGQTEAPLMIRPYLERMTTSELLAVMSGGMATIAGGILAVYVVLLGSSYAALEGIDPQLAQLRFAEYLIGASAMAAPAALVISKMLIPETEQPATDGSTATNIDVDSRNIIDAAATGASDGLKLALNVGAMLIAFLGLIAMADYALGWITGLVGAEMTLGSLLGWVLSPLAWLIGVPWEDAAQFGSFLGFKVVANEFVAYLQLASAMESGLLQPKTVVMATFALCGFANFASIAMQIGGIGPLAPSRKSEVAQLGLKAVLAGMLANLMTATIAGVIAT